MNAVSNLRFSSLFLKSPYMQLVTPSVVVTAVRIEMTRLMMNFHFSLLIVVLFKNCLLTSLSLQ